MRTFIAGCKGQLGRDLISVFTAAGEVEGADLPELNVADADAVAERVKSAKPVHDLMQQHGLSGPISEQGRERILLVAVGEHLDRTQMMLVEIVNEEELDLPAAQERAETLLASNRLYRQSLPASADPVLNAVLEDLERVLLDIAHGSSEPDGALDQVRARIEKRGLLFKVRIIGSQVRQQEKKIRAEASANRT